ncbi:VWA domain-containing protein [Puteibacter caeruleilacunae]|nr:VWA domain-containing protein [Puteibacter caeruleilacunae]
MDRYTFANPEFFYLLLLLIPIVAWYIFKHRTSSATIQVSTTRGLDKAPVTYKHIIYHALFAMKMMAIAALIAVLARPQATENWQNVTTEGIDVVIALDISGSMLARDFTPDRLEAAKDVAMEFIAGRRDDKIGLVVFSGESFTQCPLTTDHAVLFNLFRDIESGMIEDGTAIGNGLATAVSRLKDSQAISKVVILLTDGENNRGQIAPVTAAEIAKTYGIRVYTIGVGTIGTAPYPFKTAFGTTQLRDVEVKIDEETLEEIAQLTDGQYFRATDNEKLKEIYEEIDKLEKSKIDVKEFSKKDEVYHRFAILAAVLLILAALLKQLFVRNLP